VTDRPKEGPKADFDAAGATGGTIPRPPSDKALDRMSEAQSLITDEWSGEPEGAGEPPGEVPPPD